MSVSFELDDRREAPDLFDASFFANSWAKESFLDLLFEFLESAVSLRRQPILLADAFDGFRRFSGVAGTPDAVEAPG
jgi:hypothetical protein